MDWNIVSAIASVCGTVLAFVSILVAIGLERQKNMSNRSKPVKKEQPRNNRQLPNELISRQRKIFNSTEAFFDDDSLGNNGNDDTPHDPFAPYLYISVGLIGACGGIASILVPWLLLIGSPELQCLLYPLLIAGLVGGVAFALGMDGYFSMEKSTPYLRFPLSAISGVLGGWIGLLGIIIWILYQMATADPPTRVYGQDEKKASKDKVP